MMHNVKNSSIVSAVIMINTRVFHPIIIKVDTMNSSIDAKINDGPDPIPN